MTTSAFDPNTFQNATFDQGFDTRTALHRPGEWIGSIGVGEKDLQFRSVEVTDKQTGQKEDRPVWEISIYADDPSAQAEGFDPPARVRHTLWIDLTADGKGLDFSPGKNRDLGHLLTALGFQDKTGKAVRPWSPMMFKGMRLRYTVKHEPRKNDPTQMDARVGSIAAL